MDEHELVWPGEAPKYREKSKKHKEKKEKPKKPSIWKRLTAEPPQKTAEEIANEENSLYNALIISLVIGIIIVIATLIIARPPPEYFTELYFKNHTMLPNYVSQNQTYGFTFVIHNLENGSFTYRAKISAELTAQNKSITKGFEMYRNITVAKAGMAEQPVNFRIEQPFYRAKITAELMNKGEEIHFWSYNKDMVYEYPDTIATISCLNHTITIGNNTGFKIGVRGDLSPALKVRYNGNQIFNTTITSDQLTNLTINQGLSSGFLDIVFDNYRWNATLKKDRAPTIEYVIVGDRKILPQEGILDGGKDASAFDCQDIQTGKPNLVVKKIGNSALRFKLEEK